MNFKEIIEKHGYQKYPSNNGAINYQDVRSLYTGKLVFVGKYLHTLFPSLLQDDLMSFLSEINVDVHHNFIEFLKKNNGLDLFSGSFVIYGFGRIKVNGLYILSRDPSISLPFHLFDENGRRIDKQKMKIGSVCDNPLFLDNTTGEVTRLDKQGKMVEKWTSIENCTNNLVERLEKWYDKQGICTSPIIIENMFFNRVKNI